MTRVRTEYRKWNYQTSRKSRGTGIHPPGHYAPFCTICNSPNHNSAEHVQAERRGESIA